MTKYFSASSSLLFDKLHLLSLIISGDAEYWSNSYQIRNNEYKIPDGYMNYKEKFFSDSQKFEGYMISLSLFYSMYKKITKSSYTRPDEDPIFKNSLSRILGWLDSTNMFFSVLDKEQKLHLSISKTSLYIECFDLTFNDELRVLSNEKIAPIAYYYFVSPGSNPDITDSEVRKYNNEDDIFTIEDRILHGQDYIVDFIKSVISSS